MLVCLIAMFKNFGVCLLGKFVLLNMYVNRIMLSLMFNIYEMFGFMIFYI